MQSLNLSQDPIVALLVELLQQMSRADSSRDTLANFMTHYSKIRPVEHYLTLAPDPFEPDAFRVLYSVGKGDLGDAILRLPKMVGTPDLSHLPLRRGGLIHEWTRTSHPKLFTDVDVHACPVFREFVPPELTSCAVLPIFRGEHVTQWTFGWSRKPLSYFDPKDVIQATMIANLLGIANRAFDSSDIIKNLNTRLRDQFDGVARVQQSLLAPIPVDFVGAQLASTSFASEQAGGDYYRVFHLPDGRMGIVIADVSGHGAAAATIVAMLHALLISYGSLCPDDKASWYDPSRVAAFCNTQLLTAGLDREFVTAFLVTYDPRTGEGQFANAGHNPPRIVRADGSIESIDQPSTLPLGIVDAIDAQTGMFLLDPGDCLVLYTDGIVELYDTKREQQFGYDRLDSVLRDAHREDRCDPAFTIERIFRELIAFRGERTRDDDQSVVVLRRVRRGAEY